MLDRYPFVGEPLLSLEDVEQATRAADPLLRKLRERLCSARRPTDPEG